MQNRRRLEGAIDSIAPSRRESIRVGLDPIEARRGGFAPLVDPHDASSLAVRSASPALVSSREEVVGRTRQAAANVSKWRARWDHGWPAIAGSESSARGDELQRLSGSPSIARRAGPHTTLACFRISHGQPTSCARFRRALRQPWRSSHRPLSRVAPSLSPNNDLRATTLGNRRVAQTLRSIESASPYRRSRAVNSWRRFA